jgi:membrane protein insertase Oxa1/YidC/SpoIIIJ
MSEADYELLRKMYGWESPINPLLYYVIIFLLIAIFLIIPYIFVNYIEVKVTTFLREIWWKISFNGRKILRIR